MVVITRGEKITSPKIDNFTLFNATYILNIYRRNTVPHILIPINQTTPDVIWVFLLVR